MLAPDDVDFIRDVLGAAVHPFEDAELVSEHRLRLTAMAIESWVEGAAEETDDDRLFLINVAQSYLIGADLVEGDVAAASSKLGDVTVSFGSPEGIAARWRARAHNLVGQLNDVKLEIVDPIVLAHGSRG